jgi:hypothetical protein
VYEFSNTPLANKAVERASAMENSPFTDCVSYQHPIVHLGPHCKVIEKPILSLKEVAPGPDKSGRNPTSMIDYDLSQPNTAEHHHLPLA